MYKLRTVKVMATIAAFCLLVFGQNCSKGFEALEVGDASSASKDTPKADPVTGLTDSEKLGLSGRIALVDIAFPPNGSVNPSFPAKLSDAKIFKNLVTLETVPGFIPFEVNMPLWSDGAIKKRWYALPEGNEKITFSKDGNWIFPKGSILVKNFELRTSPMVVRRLETRVYVNETAGWAGYSYKWNVAGTEADLMAGTSPVAEVYTVEDTMGVQTQQTWSYPSRGQCTQCHQNGGFALGMRTLQMNKFVSYGSGSFMNQLQVLNELKLISADMPDLGTLDAFPRLDNNYISVESRARAYLSVNCGTCHSTGVTAAAPANVKLLSSIALSDMNIVNAPANNLMNLGTGAVRIKPGDKSMSTLFSRINTTDTSTRMPKVGSTVVDQTAVTIIGQWIDSLPQ